MDQLSRLREIKPTDVQSRFSRALNFIFIFNILFRQITGLWIISSESPEAILSTLFKDIPICVTLSMGGWGWRRGEGEGGERIHSFLVRLSYDTLYDTSSPSLYLWIPSSYLFLIINYRRTRWNLVLHNHVAFSISLLQRTHNFSTDFIIYQ